MKFSRQTFVKSFHVSNAFRALIQIFKEPNWLRLLWLLEQYNKELRGEVRRELDAEDCESMYSHNPKISASCIWHPFFFWWIDNYSLLQALSEAFELQNIANFIDCYGQALAELEGAN